LKKIWELKMKFELIEIEEIQQEEFMGTVYDLEVEEDHSYVANDIVVHNSCCTTRIKTGCGVPTFSSVLDASKVKNQTDTHIIADGGLKTSGDIVKALAAGADLVMLGSLFAGTDEAPGEILEVNGKKMKEFRGMASKDAQMDWRGSAAGGVEGVSTLTPYKGSLENIVESLAQGVRSGLSYVGARTIEELQDNPEFIEISSGGLAESKPHALK
jgi:IMP dehydrogenase